MIEPINRRSANVMSCITRHPRLYMTEKGITLLNGEPGAWSVAPDQRAAKEFGAHCMLTLSVSNVAIWKLSSRLQRLTLLNAAWLVPSATVSTPTGPSGLPQ